MERNYSKEIRSCLRMTQAEFATYIGASIRTVQGWEQRGTMPKYVYNILVYLVQEKEKNMNMARGSEI